MQMLYHLLSYADLFCSSVTFFLMFQAHCCRLVLLGRCKESSVLGQPLWAGRCVLLGMQCSGFSNTMLCAAMCVCKEPTGCSSCRDARLIWQLDWFCQVTVRELSPASNPLPYPLEELGGGREVGRRGGELSGDFVSLLAWNHSVIISSRVVARGWLSVMSSA